MSVGLGQGTQPHIPVEPSEAYIVVVEDTIANFILMVRMLSFMGVLLTWMAINTWALGRSAFDPYPYILLNLLLSCVAALQAPIIMMSQNRQGEKDRLRADLDYQVNLKNELSITEVLRRLDVLESERLPKLVDDLKVAIEK